ncbi:MAG TPA: alpha-galactosidase [Pseudonocardia sp.]|nr:alpha-galactosidase [Pseudonocardia sp.]
MAHPTGATVAMTASGVTVLIDVAGGLLPAVVHWGRELPGLDAEQAEALRIARIPVIGSNNADIPLRVAVVPEQHAGWMGRPGLSGSRAGRAWSPRLRTRTVRLDGAGVSGFVGTGAGRLEVTAADAEAGLELLLTMELTPSGLLRSRAAVTNTGDEDYGLDDLVLAYPVPAEAAELLDFAGRHNRERIPQRRPFGVGTHLRENRKGRAGADSAYALHAGVPGFGFTEGEVYAVHTAWSGDHTHYAERVFTGERVLGGGELLLPGEIRLASGQTYQGPWLYGAYGSGLDAVAHRFHRHVRARPEPVAADRPVTLNVWEAVYFAHDRDRLLDLAERAAAVGVERYVLDDGWFGARRDDRAGLGDWVVSREVWPDGLHPLIDRVRKLGMEFGLWFEPEMVNADSDVARAHPEWIMTARTEWPIEARHQQVLNLGVPEAYEHVKGQMMALLDEYDIGYIKWDHNRDLIEAGTAPDGGRPGVHAQTLAFYRLIDELKAAHPGLEIESCSSGGARVDLGVLERADRVWVSDCIDPHERQAMLRWTAQLVPPEYLGSHIASGRSHTTGRVHDLGFRAGTAIFGHLGIEWDLAEASEHELAELRKWISFYKEHRALLLAGDMVRMDTESDELFVHGVVAPDRSRAIFAMATMSSSTAVVNPPLRLRGLDPERRYRLRPLLVGALPSGLVAPQWWGGAAAGGQFRAFHPADPGSGGSASPDPDFPGSVFTGAALAAVGVAAPMLHPDQVVLLGASRL